ncbi:MAG: DNA polymerase I, partial [Oligoflexia bacterium]|nr:DNA polymerase I [Oligoflexia bacterium]
SNSKYIFGPSVWIRGLIKPRKGFGVAYIDWEQQEFGIAGVLSGDNNMKDAYRSGDPYLEFAIMSGAAPKDATKASHGTIRGLFKECALGVQYGMGEQALSEKINQPPIKARELLILHKKTFPTFWNWSNGVIDYGMYYNYLHTVFGWGINVNPNTKPGTLRNFLMQANGAEMLRLACCFITSKGVCVCGPAHDALIIEAPLDRLDNDIAIAREEMAHASRIVLEGFELRTEVEIVRYPDRYMDHKRGEKMWNTVHKLIEQMEVNVAQ